MVDISQLRRHLRVLEKGDEASRRQSIHTLRLHEPGDWGNAPVRIVRSLVSSLVKQLPSRDNPQPTGKEAAILLGNLGSHSRSAVPRLMELLNDNYPDPVREAAAVALGKIGKEARPAVDQLIQLTSGRNNLATHAVRALSEIGCADHRVRTALVNLWLTPVQAANGQIQVAIALCKLGIDARGLVRTLAATLVANQDVNLRKSAAEALSMCDKNAIDVVPSLLTASLADKNEEIRLLAQRGLEQLRVSQEVAIQISSKQLKESFCAETALRKSGAPAIPALVKALSVNSSIVRVKAARTLACLGELGLPAAPALATLLKDRDPDVRLAAAKGLWNVNKNSDAVVPVLVKLLDEKLSPELDADARRQYLQTVIEALSRIGPPAIAAKPALMKQTRDKNRLISESAQIALQKIMARA